VGALARTDSKTGEFRWNSGFLQSCSETVPKRLDSTEAPGAAGVVASPAARWLDAGTRSRRARVKVRVDLSVPSHSDIFAVGDTAAVTVNSRYRGAGEARDLLKATDRSRQYAGNRLRQQFVDAVTGEPVQSHNKGT
jgi:hypothetical protein